MDFREFMAMLVEQADKYRDNFQGQDSGSQITRSLTATEYAASFGGISCSAHLTLEGRISDTQTGIYVSFMVRPSTRTESCESGPKVILGA